MYTRRNIALPIILRFAWRNLLFFVGWSVLVTLLHGRAEEMGFHLGIPFAPLSTIGIAVAFYMGFKNSQVLRSTLGGPQNLGCHCQRQPHLESHSAQRGEDRSRK